MKNKLTGKVFGFRAVDPPTRPPPPPASDLAESYRVKLGLRPWSEMGGGRKSGKTTRMILEALAASVVNDQRVIIATIEHETNRVQRLVRMYADELGIKSRVEVMTHRMALTRGWFHPRTVRFLDCADVTDPEARRWVVKLRRI